MKPYHHEVKYYECDGMGITHHSNYIRFMEEARVDWMEQLGYGFDRMESEGIVSPVVSVECRYRKTTTFKDDITIVVSVKEITPLKFVFVYSMSVSGKIVCTAQSTHCFFEKGKPVSLEQRFPVLYENIIEMYPECVKRV
ncbi:MAG: acyl-CoA thioesterase [Bacteroidales bacterium]|nr:acyl-CoA thioesterase [Bacteroidales bacterium]MCR5192979.1 acyl-CoA thioesterase [Bacteroidales bacterium]